MNANQRSGERFIQLYNELDQYLRRSVDARPEDSFAFVVKAAANRGNTAVRSMRNRLISYGELRNAIVHDPRYPTDLIADPRPEVVEDLARVVALVTSPPRLTTELRHQPDVFEETEPLITVLRSMQANDFSQVVVRSASTLRVLTANGIAGWLTTHAEEHGFLVTEGLVSHALPFEQSGIFTIMDRDATLFDAYEYFSRPPEEGHGRPSVVLVTHSGKPTETPLAIATPWDVLSVVQLTNAG